MTDFLAAEDHAQLERHGLGSFDALWTLQLDADLKKPRPLLLGPRDRIKDPEPLLHRASEWSGYHMRGQKEKC